MIRKIIHIDEEKCNGCGACVTACHEGAIGLVNGKAKLMRDDYCDGFGDCLPGCPTGAITFTEREAAAYSEQLLKQAGYKPFVPGMALNTKKKNYLINRSKCVLAATIGERSMAEGFHLNIAHIPILYLFDFALWIALCVLTFIGWRMRWGEKSEGAEK